MPETAPAPLLLTRLEPDPFAPGAVRVTVNGRFFCAVPADSPAVQRLAQGAELDPRARGDLERAADEEAAYRTALRLIALRPHARVELGRRLVRKGHPPDAVEPALERAVRAGLLDDAEFARRYVETRSERGRGPRRVARDLAGMGVPRGAIESAVSARWPESDAADTMLRELATRRAAQLGALPRDTKRRRLVGFLARRGFTGPQVRDIVTALVR